MFKVVYILLLTLFAYQHVFAQEYTIDLESPKNTIIHFDIPRQPLKSCLIEFALQAKISIITRYNVLPQVQTKPIKGRYTIEEALSLIVGNTDLAYTYLKQHQSFIITPVQKKVINTTANTGPTIEEVIVRSSKYPFRYSMVASSSQSHPHVSSFDSAHYINIIPNTLIVDQNPNEISDVLRNTSGVSPGYARGDSNDDFYIRGFARNALYVDGLRLNKDAGSKVQPHTIEQIEILKGPSTLFYGQAEPGGIVNVIKKKASFESRKHIKLASGSGASHHLDFDLNGSLNKAYNIAGRLVGGVSSQGQYRDSRQLKTFNFFPSLLWQISDKLTSSADYEYQFSSFERPQGNIVLTPDNSEIRLLELEGPSRLARPDFSSQSHRINVDLSYEYNGNWISHFKLAGQQENRKGVRVSNDILLTSGIFSKDIDLNSNSEFINIAGIYLPVKIGTQLRTTAENNQNSLLSVATLFSFYDQQGQTNSLLARGALKGSFDTGSLTHHLNLGGDIQREDIFESFLLEERSDIQSVNINSQPSTSPVDLIQSIIDKSVVLGNLNRRLQGLDYIDYGVYAQNNIDLSPLWMLSIGARYNVTTGSQSRSGSNLIKLKRHNNLSSNMGLVFHPSDDWSLYLNYSEAMSANYQLDDQNTVIEKPELSDQIELGSKSILMGGKLIATMALFSINKNNIVEYTITDGQRVAILGASQSTFGYDLDLSYQISHHLDLISAVSLLQPRIKTGLNAGNLPRLAAEQTASLYVNYKISALTKNTTLKNMRINAGIYHIGERYGNNDNTFVLGQYTTLDIGFSLPFKIASAQARLSGSIKNVSDERFLTAIEGDLRFNPGSLRVAEIGLTMGF